MYLQLNKIFMHIITPAIISVSVIDIYYLKYNCNQLSLGSLSKNCLIAPKMFFKKKSIKK